MLGAVTDNEFKQLSNQQNVLGEMSTSQSEIQGYNLEVKIKAMDQFGRSFKFSDQKIAMDNKSTLDGQDDIAEDEEEEAKESIEYESNVIDAAYLKVINVPCMYDMGTLPTDPSDSRLCLNVLDDQSYHKVIKTDFLTDKSKLQRRKVDKFKEAI